MRLVDRMGAKRNCSHRLPRSAGNSPAIVETLADVGLSIPSTQDNFRKVCAYLNASAQGFTMTKTTRTLAGIQGQRHVLPDVVLGMLAEPLYVGTEKTKLSQAGTLEG